jgi:hypothetical protein
MMRTSHLLIHPPHLQRSKYKDLSLEARAKKLNYQVLSFLGTLSYIHENMMLPKSDVFVTLRNDGLSMDERDKHWSMKMATSIRGFKRTPRARISKL